MKEQYYKIKRYIESTYNIPVEETKDYFNDYVLLLKAKKYDIKIGIKKPSERHFLYRKSEYVLEFDFNANKKYQTELCYHGGGWDDEYNEDNYNNIDEFLSEWFIKPNEKQLSLFDI